MSVSSNLLCSFELLKPLDSSALKSHIKKGRNARNNMLNSPVSLLVPAPFAVLTVRAAGRVWCAKHLRHASQRIEFMLS
jgi:serine/threonine-protein phosphatase PP1 catalytic subunit